MYCHDRIAVRVTNQLLSLLTHRYSRWYLSECSSTHRSHDVHWLSVVHVLHERPHTHTVRHRHRPLETGDALRVFVPLGRNVEAEQTLSRRRVEDCGGSLRKGV